MVVVGLRACTSNTWESASTFPIFFFGFCHTWHICIFPIWSVFTWFFKMYFSDSLKCIHLILICGGGGGGRAFVPVDRMRKCRSSSFIPSCSLTFLYCIWVVFALYLPCICPLHVLYLYNICVVFVMYCMRKWRTSSLTFLPTLQFLPRVNDPRNLVSLLKKYGFEIS